MAISGIVRLAVKRDRPISDTEKPIAPFYEHGLKQAANEPRSDLTMMSRAVNANRPAHPTNPIKLPKTFTCVLCGMRFTRHDEGYRHWVTCSTTHKREERMIRPHTT